MRRRRIKMLLALCAAAALGGCASARTMEQARSSLAQAKEAGAETKAPYDYYAAAGYLGIAEHEYGEVDLSAAREFAKKSAEHSAQALQKAGGGGR